MRWLLVSLVGMAVAGCGDDTISITPGPAAQTLGSGSCAALAIPSNCNRDDTAGSEFEASCLVGPQSQTAKLDGEAVLPTGCVGFLGVLRASIEPTIQDPGRFGMWVAAPSCAIPQCAPEASPQNAIATIVTYHPSARALFVRSAEPVTRPSQVAGFVHDFTPLPPGVTGGLTYRFAVSAAVK